MHSIDGGAATAQVPEKPGDGRGDRRGQKNYREGFFCEQGPNGEKLPKGFGYAAVSAARGPDEVQRAKRKGKTGASTLLWES